MTVAEALADEFNDMASELYAAYTDHYGVDYTKDDDAADVVERIRDAYLGTYRTREDWAAEWADDTGMLDNVPENLKHYFDFDAWARDAHINGDVDFVAGGEGVLVFTWD